MPNACRPRAMTYWGKRDPMSDEEMPEKSRAATIKVALVRPIFGPREWSVPPGTTVGDLIARAKANALDHFILVGAEEVDPTRLLNEGDVVSLVPRTRASIGRMSWRDTVGMFKDDPTFEEMVQAGRAIREADRAASGKKASKDRS
jgi:hypothetical protein